MIDHDLKDFSKVTVKDILPEDDVLNLAIQSKQITLPIHTQKEIVSLLINDTIDKDKILKRKKKSSRIIMQKKKIGLILYYSGE